MMMRDNPVAGARALTLAAILALVLGMASCGSDDEDGGGSDDSAANAAQKRSGDGGGGGDIGTEGDAGAGRQNDPDAQIRATYDELIDLLYKKDMEAACSMMTASLLKKQFGSKVGCAKQFKAIFAGQGKPPEEEDRAKIVKLTINGSKASGAAKARGDDVSSPIQFTKKGGEWMVSGFESG
jgi:hypothetical protein